MKKLFFNERASVRIAPVSHDGIHNRQDYSSFSTAHHDCCDDKQLPLKDIGLELVDNLHYEDELSFWLKPIHKILSSTPLLLRAVNSRLEQWKLSMDSKFANLKRKALVLSALKNKDEQCGTYSKMRYNAGLTVIETLLALVLGILIIGLAFFVYERSKSSSDQTQIAQTASTLFGAVESAKANNGGYYPAGSIANLGNFPVSSVSSGNDAAGLIGAALCPNVPSGSNCTIPQMNNWTYSCNASSGGTSTATITLTVPPNELGILNSIQTEIQSAYTGWQCTQSSSTLSCSLANVICQ